MGGLRHAKVVGLNAHLHFWGMRHRAVGMRMLFLGDVVGRAGRAAIVDQLSDLRQAWKLDFVVVNAENATSGAGLNAAHAKAILRRVLIVSRWAIMPLIKKR